MPYLDTSLFGRAVVDVASVAAVVVVVEVVIIIIVVIMRFQLNKKS